MNLDYKGDVDWNLDVEVNLTRTHEAVPAFTNGPPELCYPSEAAEYEVNSITMLGVEFVTEMEKIRSGEDRHTLEELKAHLGEDQYDELIEEATMWADGIEPPMKGED